MFLCRRVRCASKWHVPARGPRRGRFRAVAGLRKGPLGRRLRVLQPAGTPLRRRAARGQAGRRRSGDRHTVRRPRACGGRDRDRGAGRLRGRGTFGRCPVCTSACSTRTGDGDRALRQQGRDRRDRLRARRVLPAPGCLEVPRGRTGLQQRTGRAGEGLRNHGGRAAARGTAPTGPRTDRRRADRPLYRPRPHRPAPTPSAAVPPAPGTRWRVRRRSGRR